MSHIICKIKTRNINMTNIQMSYAHWISTNHLLNEVYKVPRDNFIHTHTTFNRHMHKQQQQRQNCQCDLGHSYTSTVQHQRYLQQDIDSDHCMFDQQLYSNASDIQNCWSLAEPISTYNSKQNTVQTQTAADSNSEIYWPEVHTTLPDAESYSQTLILPRAFRLTKGQSIS